MSTLQKKEKCVESHDEVADMKLENLMNIYEKLQCEMKFGIFKDSVPLRELPTCHSNLRKKEIGPAFEGGREPNEATKIAVLPKPYDCEME